MLFHQNFRPFTSFDLEPSQISNVPDAFAYVDIFITNGQLHVSLKEKHNFGITKNGKREVIFDMDDLALLNGIELEQDRQNYIVLNSNGWNAKKPADYTIRVENKLLSRGLTLIHFYENDKYEFRTFDTYGRADDAAAFVKALQKLMYTDTPFIILASDSAT